MKYNSIHPWDLSPREAAALQAKLRPLVEIKPLPGTIRRVVGADACYRRDTVRGAVVVIGLPEFETVEQSTAERAVAFPYLPGLFAFREGPVLLDCFAKLTAAPDVILFHGHGICHPHGFGLASHLGLLLGLPSVGCALRTRSQTRPLIVSPGHRTDLAGSRRIVLSSCRGFRMPEPLRRAHALARTGWQGGITE